jgi:hypothetical protein
MALMKDSLQPYKDHLYNRRFPLSDCRDGRRTGGFVREFHSVKDETLQVTMNAGNRAQSLKRLYTVQGNFDKRDNL